MDALIACYGDAGRSQKRYNHATRDVTPVADQTKCALELSAYNECMKRHTAAIVAVVSEEASGAASASAAPRPSRSAVGGGGTAIGGRKSFVDGALDDFRGWAQHHQRQQARDKEDAEIRRRAASSSSSSVPRA